MKYKCGECETEFEVSIKRSSGVVRCPDCGEVSNIKRVPRK